MTATVLRGAKHTCASCVTRFYDLNNTPVICPKCGVKVAVKVARASGRRTRRTVDAAQDHNPLSPPPVIAAAPKAKFHHVKWK